jgi:hypothetical protein
MVEYTLTRSHRFRLPDSDSIRWEELIYTHISEQGLDPEVWDEYVNNPKLLITDLSLILDRGGSLTGIYQHWGVSLIDSELTITAA